MSEKKLVDCITCEFRNTEFGYTAEVKDIIIDDILFSVEQTIYITTIDHLNPIDIYEIICKINDKRKSFYIHFDSSDRKWYFDMK